MSVSKCPGMNDIKRSDAERRILRHGWIADQPKEVSVAVLKIARLVFYPAGDFVFHADDSAGGMHGVVTGGVGIHIPAAGGESVLAHVARCGVWFGYGPFLRGRRRSLTFSLTEPSWLTHVPLSGIQKIARRSLMHQHALLSVSEYGMDVATKVIETLLIRDSDCRIAATLLRVAPPREDDESAPHPDILLTQAKLGEMANLDRQIVNRILRQMEAKGWVQVSYGRIRIVDPTALEAFAQSC
jgi:CRP/FNR family cyclic AMP-dependent transcriptional regulator